MMIFSLHFSLIPIPQDDERKSFLQYQNFLLFILLTHSFCRLQTFSPARLNFLVLRPLLVEPFLNLFLALVRASLSRRAMYMLVLSIVTERGFPIIFSIDPEQMSPFQQYIILYPLLLSHNLVLKTVSFPLPFYEIVLPNTHSSNTISKSTP